MVKISSMLIVLFNLISAYKLCSESDYIYAGKNISVSIAPSATKALKGTPVTVSGGIEVVDGCTFKLVNFLVNGGNYTYTMFGGVGSDLDGIRLISESLAFGKVYNEEYTFIKTVGAFVSYEDFDQFRVFVISEQAVVGVANLPGGKQVPKSTRTSIAAEPTVGSNDSPNTGSTTDSNSCTSKSVSLVVLFLIFLL